MDNFIDDMINDGDKVITRFPPEPNGYLHLGHFKSIHTNFELANKYGGKCNLRFDNTNPTAESDEFVEAIKNDIEWLGYSPDETHTARERYDFIWFVALNLIKTGKAYVCDLTPDEMAEHIGTPTMGGILSPYRDREIDENLDLLVKMKKGEFEAGTKTLRAKIDMASPNMHMRDPILYRVKDVDDGTLFGARELHPMYDFAHPICDYCEGITHSICTLEFEVHRPLYEWILNNGLNDKTHPRQIEFARLNVSHTIMSKRKLKVLVDEGVVDGWDDPRMPTISGMRRRGIPVDALKMFAEKIGVTKRESLVDMSLLDSCTREVLNKTSNRRMVVFDPLKVTITNWKMDKGHDWLTADVNPEDEEAGIRMVNFGRTLLIEREDFMEDAPKKFFRLSLGKEVRFKYGYYVTCNEVIKDENGKVIELLCTYDPETRGGWIEGRKVKGTIHWVNAKSNLTIDVNLYDRLFDTEVPTDDFINEVNLDSKKTVKANMEAAGPHARDEYLQFERNGYYKRDANGEWNKTLALRDGWKK